MKFFLAKLLLIFPAWAIAYTVAPHTATEIDRSTHRYRHEIERTNIKNMRSWAIHYSDSSGRKFADADVAYMWADIAQEYDEWGNKYQLVELDEHKEDWPPSPLRDETQLHEFPTPFHVYSLGEDGKSDTNGNDADDINSWNHDRTAFYDRKIANEMKLKFLWRTLWLTPIIYLSLCVAVQACKSLPWIAR